MIDFRQKLHQILKGYYACDRVWEAWQYGTMKESDFRPLEEDENIYNDIEELFQEESLEDIIEDIGKRMCHLQLLYPNAGKWMIQDRWGWEYEGETLIEVFKKFREELKRSGLYI